MIANRLPLLRLDRTRTTTLRRQFAAELTRRHRALARRIHDHLASDVTLFFSATERIIAFQRWLESEIHHAFFAVDWWSPLVSRVYVAGASHAYDDVRRVALREPSLHQAGKAEFLRLLMRQDNHSMAANARQTPFRDVRGQFMSERVRVLSLRLRSELRGATDAMAQVIARELINGHDKGLSPEAIAKNIERVCLGIGKSRALTIANTEATRMAAEGQLDAFAALGIESVGAQVEWTTAGNPCQRCAEMSGHVFAIDEARDLIPFHPHCMCSWSAVEGQSQRGEI